MMRSAPSGESASCSSPAFMSGPMARRSAISTGPVSRPASICMVMTPVSASPAMIACWIAAPPARQQRGVDVDAAEPRRIEIGCGRMRPWRRPPRRVEAERRDSACASVLFSDFGVITGMAFAPAKAWTGDFEARGASGGRRLAVDGGDLVPGRDQRGERGDRERRRPHEGEPQSHGVSRRGALRLGHLPRDDVALQLERWSMKSTPPGDPSRAGGRSPACRRPPSRPPDRDSRASEGRGCGRALHVLVHFGAPTGSPPRRSDNSSERHRISGLTKKRGCFSSSCRRGPSR